MRQIGGIIGLKPIGIMSNSPGLNQAQIDANQIAAEQRQAQQQAKVDALVDKLAQQHQANQMKPIDPNQTKRWSVKY
jgi:hemoglobin-like flavoprotein